MRREPGHDDARDRGRSACRAGSATSSSRDYYGTVNHNVKAVPPALPGAGSTATREPARAAAGRGREAPRRAPAAPTLSSPTREAFARRVPLGGAVVNHLVFADPANRDARLLQADALEQLGYQAESGPWRAFYRTAAQELRNGVPCVRQRPFGVAAADVARAMTSDMLFDYLGVRLDGDRAAGTSLELTFRVTDRDGCTRSASPTARCTTFTAAPRRTGDLVALAHERLLGLVRARRRSPTSRRQAPSPSTVIDRRSRCCSDRLGHLLLVPGSSGRDSRRHASVVAKCIPAIAGSAARRYFRPRGQGYVARRMAMETAFRSGGNVHPRSSPELAQSRCRRPTTATSSHKRAHRHEPPAKFRHGWVEANLHRTLGRHIDERSPGIVLGSSARLQPPDRRHARARLLVHLA